MVFPQQHVGAAFQPALSFSSLRYRYFEATVRVRAAITSPHLKAITLTYFPPQDPAKGKCLQTIGQSPGPYTILPGAGNSWTPAPAPAAKDGTILDPSPNSGKKNFGLTPADRCCASKVITLLRAEVAEW